jgi:hypothetical protein
MPTRAAVRDERNPAGYTLAGFFRVRAGMYTVQSGPGPPPAHPLSHPRPRPPGHGGGRGGPGLLGIDMEGQWAAGLVFVCSDCTPHGMAWLWFPPYGYPVCPMLRAGVLWRGQFATGHLGVCF